MEASRWPQDAFTDKLGQEVKPGDRIVYGHAEGRSACLRLGKVLTIEQVLFEYTTKKQWSIKVQGVRNTYVGPRLCERPGVLQFPDRIVKIDRLPPDIEVLFESPNPH